MEKYQIGDTVRVIQPTKDQHKVGKILSVLAGGAPIYWTIEGMKHAYKEDQIELVSSSRSLINNTYEIY